MQKIKQALLPTATDIKRRVIVLSGMGGIGKTQLATAFCRDYKDAFSAILWLKGNTKDDIRRSLVSYAAQIPKDQIEQREIPTNKDAEDQIANDVMGWLAKEGNYDWLLVFDNVDLDEKSPREREQGAYNVMSYVPGNHGAVLITTRREDTDHYGGREVKLEPVGMEMSRRIFDNWYGIEEGTSSPLCKYFDLTRRFGSPPSYCVPKHTKSRRRAYTFLALNNEHTHLLLERLSGLPLAIAQSARYMKIRQATTAMYIRLWDERWDHIMGHDKYLRDYPTSVTMAWTISMDQVRQTGPSGEYAYELVRMWAFLNNADFWHGLLSEAESGPSNIIDDDPDDLTVAEWKVKFRWTELPGWFSKLSKDREAFSDTMHLLLDYCLIERTSLGESESHRSYSMHPVVHKWAMHIQGSDVASLCLALNIFKRHKPWQTEDWQSKSRWMPHADRCCAWLEATSKPELVEAGRSPARLYFTLLKLAELYQCVGALQETIKILEPLSSYAWPASSHGKAIPWMLLRDAAIFLGHSYYSLKEPAQAEKHYETGVQLTREAVGDQHILTLSSTSLLAACYTRQKRTNEAENLPS